MENIQEVADGVTSPERLSDVNGILDDLKDQIDTTEEIVTETDNKMSMININVEGVAESEIEVEKDELALQLELSSDSDISEDELQPEVVEVPKKQEEVDLNLDVSNKDESEEFFDVPSQEPDIPTKSDSDADGKEFPPVEVFRSPEVDEDNEIIIDKDESSSDEHVEAETEEDDDDDDMENGSPRRPGEASLNLTGFLFGNIDTKTGKLENNYLFDGDDSHETEKHLKALHQLGVASEILEDEGNTEKVSKKKEKFALDSDESDSDKESDSESDDEKVIVDAHEDFLDKLVAQRRANLVDKFDSDKKSPSAEDYSDIQELANDDGHDSQIRPSSSEVDDEDYDNLEDDQRKMPPPSIFPMKRTSKSKHNSGPGSESEVPTQKKLGTPLAAMLPSKYAGVAVTTLFPDFRPDKVLRFARLFGPGKPTSLPQIWKNVKKRRKKRAMAAEAEQLDLTDMNLGTLDKPNLKKKEIVLESASDDEEYYLKTADKEKEEDLGETNKNQIEGKSSLVPPAIWRHGPASLWYEMLGVPEDATHFDYGFKALKANAINNPKEDEDEDQENQQVLSDEKHFEDDAFHLATQSDWESSIIWDSQDAKLKNKFSKSKIAGWVPSGVNRTAYSKTESTTPGSKSGPLQFSQPATTSKSKSKHQENEDQVDDTWYSIFPVETEELVKYSWEDEIIWDVEKIDKIPEPKILALDPNDKNIILCMPDDIDPSSAHHTPPVKVKIPHPHVKKSKILLGKAGVINVIEEDSPPPSPKKDDMDPYNISNDEYYAPKHTEQSLLKISASGNIIQHSTPVVELRAPFIPTHMGPMKLRNFHRPSMKKYSTGALGNPGPHPLYALTKHIAKKAKQRENERLAAGGGDIFVWRTPEDISGKDGRLVLIEYCEEHPPLLSQVGMCSKLKNYFKRHAEKNMAPPELKLGETTYAHTSPFLGIMHPGELIQTIENNLYRAPIYEHQDVKTDFILIRTRSSFWVREYDHIFTAGQECPLYEVPGPNSKRSNNFVRDFLQVFIYRLFWRSRDTPRRIRMDDIKRAFPMHSESSIRKRLKLCADFKRTGVDSNWWVIKPEFRLPTEEEIRAMVSPEQCCAYFSLIAAEQRLKDAGYGEKFLFAPQDDDDEENQGKIDDEVKTAPWNTTRAYIQAMKGKCLLQLMGPADPTGIGEGFSYIRVPNKPQTSKEEQESQPKRIVTGTDADLRRLSLSNAKNLLRKFMVPEEEIQKLSRWEVIDVVRTLSTEKAKQGEKGIIKFSRGNRFSVAEHQERYKEECQRIFELQNRVLMAPDPLTSDEEESNEEEEMDDDAIEEMGKNIENMLSNKKSTSQLVHEREEQERLELQKMIMGDGKDGKQGKKSKNSKENEEAKMEEDNKINKLTSVAGRVLKIHRKFKAPDGREYTRTETVRKPAVIDIYVRMRAMKDEAFIRSFTLLDDQAKEEMKKEKRRIQEQLRRIKRNQEKEHVKVVRVPVVKKKKIKMKPDLKMKCGACGQQGHMRTNKACPYYQGGSTSPVPPINVAMTEEQEEEIEKELQPEEGEELVKLDGTKVHLSTKLLKHAEDVKRRSLLLKVPREAMSRKYKKKAREEGDYYRKDRTTNRRRVDPRVMISNIFESVLNDMKNEPDSNCFVAPVSQKTPRYYEIVKTPMDLQTMREKIRQRKYDSRQDFLSDSKLLVSNSVLYNGEKHLVTAYAHKIFGIAEKKIEENASKLSRYEKMINPLLDDNYKRKLNYILSKIIDKAKLLPEASSFLKPVNKKTFKNYYEVIENPMDLDTMEKKIRDGLYNNRFDFLVDMDLIHSNSVQYNGGTSSISEKAATLVEFVKTSLQPFDEHLTQLELSIQKDDAEKIEESDSEFGGSDQDELTVGPLEGDDSLSSHKFTKDDSRSMISESIVEFGDDETEGATHSKAVIQAKAGFSGIIQPSLSLEETLAMESRKRTREDSGSIGGWYSGSEASNDVASKRSRTESLDTESQQAVEAMMQLSKATPTFLQTPRLSEDTDSRGGVINTGTVEDYASQSIHADLEVSDSESDSSN